MKNREAYETGIRILQEVGIEEARTDTRLLLEELCHVTGNDIYVHGEELLPPKAEQIFLEALEKRKQHIPLQQITGVQEFMGLTFQVNENVLIPRQDTEILVEEALKELQDGYEILDMCTGSGCILLSLLHYSNHCKGVGADISDQALAVAKQNAQNLKIQADFIQSDLFTEITGNYDMIVSNPPYIQTDVIETLMPEVREHEPVLALDGKEDGCFFYRQIVQKSRKYLKGGGMLFFEIGYDQGKTVKDLMEQNGFREVNVIQDYAGLDRVVFGTLFGGNTDV